jgi:hypothetical protein
VRNCTEIGREVYTRGKAVSGPWCGQEQEQADVHRAILRDAMHARWDDLADEERAFLVYCLRRLDVHRNASQPWQHAEDASERDTTGTACTTQDAGDILMPG